MPTVTRLATYGPVTGSTSLTITPPIGRKGDLWVLVVATIAPGPTINVPSGFTNWGSGGTEGSYTFRGFYRQCDGTESGDVTISITSGTSSIAWLIHYDIDGKWRPAVAIITGGNDANTGANGITCNSVNSSIAVDWFVSAFYLGDQTTSLSNATIGHTTSVLSATTVRASGTWDGGARRYHESDAVVTGAGASSTYTFRANGTDSGLTGATIWVGVYAVDWSVTNPTQTTGGTTVSGIGASVAGDLDVLATWQNSGSVVINTSGFKLVAAYSGVEWQGRLWVRRCDGTEATSVSISYTGSVRNGSSFCRYRGVNGLVRLVKWWPVEDNNSAGADGYTMTGTGISPLEGDYLGAHFVGFPENVSSVALAAGNAEMAVTTTSTQVGYGGAGGAKSHWIGNANRVVLSSGSGNPSLTAAGSSQGLTGAAFLYQIRSKDEFTVITTPIYMGIA